MKRKILIITVLILLLSLSLPALSGCSEEQKGLKKFCGEYEKLGLVGLAISDGDNSILDINYGPIIELKEKFLYSANLDYLNLLVRYQNLDANVVAAINEDVALLGNKLKINGIRIRFTDNGVSCRTRDAELKLNGREYDKMFLTLEDDMKVVLQLYEVNNTIVATVYGQVSGTDDIEYSYHFNLHFANYQ